MGQVLTYLQSMQIWVIYDSQRYIEAQSIFILKFHDWNLGMLNIEDLQVLQRVFFLQHQKDIIEEKLSSHILIHDRTLSGRQSCQGSKNNDVEVRVFGFRSEETTAILEKDIRVSSDQLVQGFREYVKRFPFKTCPISRQALVLS